MSNFSQFLGLVVEDAAAATNPAGPQTMARRRDSLVAEVSNDGDALAINATNKGEVYVKHSDGISPIPAISGGLTPARLISGASTNATSLKSSAGQLYTIYAINTNAAVRYLKFYNKASAPTVGTDVPVLTLPIPGNTAGAGFLLSPGGQGIEFTTGIAYATTTGVADADTGAVAANELVVNFLFK